MSVSTKMTAIADEIRILSGTDETMGLDGMASNISEANEEILSQADLLTQLTAALEGKAIPSEDKTLLWSYTFSNTAINYHHELELGFDLKAGTKYIVIFDNIEYVVVCENLVQHVMLAIGNKHIPVNTYEDTGEPFFIYQKTGSDVGQFMVVSAAGPHTVEIYLPISTGTSSNGSSTALFGKNILILGDSVNSGAGWEGGFANLISEDFFGVSVRNASVSGQKFSGEQIYYQLVREYQNGFIPDYIVFDGGGNDMLANVTTGEVDLDTYSVNFDTNTIAGAFEHLVVNAQKFIPNAKLIFVNLYKLNPVAAEVTYSKQREVWNLLHKACEKYGVYYVDLYNKSNFTPAIQEQWDNFMFDWIHINESGYRRFWPLIKNALLTI